VDYGVSVNVIDSYGYSPLHMASKGNHINLMKYLVEELHINVFARTLAGYSALFFACQNGNLEAVRYLIEECKLDPNDKTNSSMSMITIAEKFNHHKVKQYLEGVIR
jgi:ankyrin repeat protein